MQLHHVDTILLVEDIAISKKFYAQVLGMEILHDWGAMVVFKDRLALHQASELQPRAETGKFSQSGGHGNVIVYLQSDDLEGAYQELKEGGVEFLHGILSLPWERLFRVYDPDHYVVEIGEPH